jgi:hypothetical protein
MAMKEFRRFFGVHGALKALAAPVLTSVINVIPIVRAENLPTKRSLALGGAIATEGKVFLTLLDYGGVGSTLDPESGTDISEFYRSMKSQ